MEDQSVLAAGSTTPLSQRKENEAFHLLGSIDSTQKIGFHFLPLEVEWGGPHS